MKNLILYFLLFLFLTACGSSNVINDFFGIQMLPEEERNFKILSYDEFQGIKYQSSSNMDTDINAWAEIYPEEIKIKIVNNSNRAIPLSYFNDVFVIITDLNKYILNKGESKNYFSSNKINPNSSDEHIFKLPSDFSQDFIKREGAILTKDIMGDFSKNWSHAQVLKDNTKYILIKLSDITLVLKKIP